MWECPRCGKRLDEKMDCCWKCGQLQYESPDDGQEPSVITCEEIKPEELSTDEMLKHLVEVQRLHSTALHEVQSRVGCLFMYLVVSLAFGGIMLLIALANR